MNPYLILGVSPSADDAAIRQAYLAAVRQSPPDTHPERFQAVSAAYDRIKDESSRLHYLLFDLECNADSPLDTFLRFVRARPPEPLPFERMREWLRGTLPS